MSKRKPEYTLTGIEKKQKTDITHQPVKIIKQIKDSTSQPIKKQNVCCPCEWEDRWCTCGKKNL